MAYSHGFKVFLSKDPVSCSNLDLEISIIRCYGPCWSKVKYGRLIYVVSEFDNSIFAFSAASLILCRAALSFDISTPDYFLNSLAKYSDTKTSISSPPSAVSPFVAFTSKTPSSTSKIEISKVPPPRSKTAITLSY